MAEISKAYEPQSVEDKWYQFWLDGKFFVANAQSTRPAYSIVIPPPNVTGVLTMGHVLNNTIQDILARKARMDGKEVLWLPGTDHAGIATQTVVERTLKKSGEIKHRDDLGREAFLKRVWEWKEKHGGIIIQQLKKLGASCDWSRERFTMDPEYSRCVQKVFVELYKKGLIYRGKRMVNWCPASLTALSDEEVVMKEQKGALYYFKVQVAESPLTPSLSPGGGEGDASKFGPVTDSEGRIWLTIATTRPETIPGDTAVAVNPKDPRYAKYIGKHVIRPLPVELPREQKLIPIIGDEHVDFEFGTGVLKVTPAHDKADYEIFCRQSRRQMENPALPETLAPIEVIGPDGFMTAAAGQHLKGLERFKARKAVVEKLTELSVLEKEEPYTNNVGFSERADVPIEPRLSEQWFLKYPSTEKSKACVAPDGYKAAVDLSQKTARVVVATGKEISGKSIHELRKAALDYARKNGIMGVPFKNEDSGREIRVGRQSLSHAFSHIGVANILAVAVLPELIRSAIWISSEPHEPHNPMVKLVHRFVAALSLGGELYSVLITAKEFYDGTVLYDHKAKKITPGGKSLEAHPREGKLDTQPAPSAGVKVSDLLADVNGTGKMRFHPQRWAKVYDHWMGGLQDWCISRQLWWGHRVPVWTKIANEEEAKEFMLDWGSDKQNSKLQKLFSTEMVGFMFHGGKAAGTFEIIGATSSPEDAKVLQQQGFTQDPDVLDTWFSSWLWPFATMGWPEQTETLKKFYPTTDLVTGPDIIFFWVARMIMAGYEFMGEMPFKNVYFTGIIRDKQGRKMSKSLGNSPDPLDLIAKYGADALRFGVMRAAPLGQDILFDEQNVELGRNFCNKLWNACRFRQLMGQTSSLSGSNGTETGKPPVPQPQVFEVQGEIEPKLLTADDKWILLKLDTALREMAEAFANYKFSDATTTLYRFFWSEYCDWYIEASKATLQGGDAARKANTIAVIDFVLSHALRMFHPFLPFITEELWHGMGYSQDMPENQGGKTIMFAPWPKALDEDFKSHYSLSESDEKIIELRNELIVQGRDLRRQANIPANKKVKFIFKPTGQGMDAEVLKLLLNAETVEVNPNYQPANNALAARHELGELFLPLEGLVDTEAEKARLKKELEKIDSELSKVEQKLANPNFTQKVPATVLEEHKKRLGDWQGKREQILAALKALGA